MCNEGSPYETVIALSLSETPSTVEKAKRNVMAARFKEKYNNEIKQAIAKELGITNAMAIPRLEKIVINMGLGEATQNVKIMDPLVADLASIAGQKAGHDQGEEVHRGLQGSRRHADRRDGYSAWRHHV